MEMELFEVIELELKYCERCGGLWLRHEGNGDVYCPSCVPRMAELPVARRRQYKETRNGSHACCEGGMA
jgi:hypothetical protein